MFLVPSQIVLMEEIQKIDISVFIVNMTVQVNCKLGGAPWFVEIDIEVLLIDKLNAFCVILFNDIFRI